MRIPPTTSYHTVGTGEEEWRVGTLVVVRPSQQSTRAEVETLVVLRHSQLTMIQRTEEWVMAELFHRQSQSNRQPSETQLLPETTWVEETPTGIPPVNGILQGKPFFPQ